MVQTPQTIVSSIASWEPVPGRVFCADVLVVLDALLFEVVELHPETADFPATFEHVGRGLLVRDLPKDAVVHHLHCHRVGQA